MVGLEWGDEPPAGLRRMRSMSVVYHRASRHRRQLKAQTLEGWEELAARSSYLGYLEWVVLVISTFNRELN